MISLSGVANPKLSFKYANMIYNLNSTMKVEAFNGTSWVQIFTTSGTSGTWGIDFNTFKYIINAYSLASNIDLTPYVNANFRLRFIYNDVGDYSYGFVMDDITITSGNVLATSDILLKDQFEVYPNPVKDNFYIRSDIKSVTKISVTDMSGKLIKTVEGKSDGYNISDLPKGTYIILITNDKEITRKKIIKQ
ncbi:T9SS type A sorting domain-containing protein [Chryseobacterium arachidis]